MARTRNMRVCLDGTVVYILQRSERQGFRASQRGSSFLKFYPRKQCEVSIRHNDRYHTVKLILLPFFFTHCSSMYPVHISLSTVLMPITSATSKGFVCYNN